MLQGTGKRAQLDGYTSAGKTGTAQKIDPATGRYSATQLIASFVGFAPINNAAITVLVQLDSPAGSHEGGSVAAPVFKRVAEQVLAYRNVPHDLALPAGALRASRRTQVDADREDIADLNPVQMDASDNAAQTEPAWPSTVAADSSISNPVSNGAGVGLLAASAKPVGASSAPASERSGLPTVELAEDKNLPVPNLAGKSVREVIRSACSWASARCWWDRASFTSKCPLRVRSYAMAERLRCALAAPSACGRCGRAGRPNRKASSTSYKCCRCLLNHWNR